MTIFENSCEFSKPRFSIRYFICSQSNGSAHLCN